MQLALSLVQLKRLNEATVWLIRALNLRPHKSTLLFNAGNLAAMMAQQGYKVGAEAILQKLVQIEPTNANNWFNLALVHQADHNENDAIRCFREVEQLKPNDEFVLLTLAKLCATTGQVQEAIGYSDKVLAISPFSEKALTMKAQLLAHDGQYPKAVKILDDAIRIYPERDAMWFILATIHEQQGNKRKALESAMKCKDALLRRNNPENLSIVNEMIQRLRI